MRFLTLLTRPMAYLGASVPLFDGGEPLRLPLFSVLPPLRKSMFRKRLPWAIVWLSKSQPGARRNPAQSRRNMIDLPSPALIGVIHLPALPGSPAHQYSMEEIIDRALADARTLKAAGFDAAIIENYGDAPFAARRIAPASIAGMAVVGERVRRETGLRLGINALRNDARAALGIAAAAGGVFIRVNVHTGVYATDQGIIEGRAAETMRYRKLLARRIALLADVNVKHAAPLGPTDITTAARDAAYRGLADGLIVTGPATGMPVDPDDLRRVRETVSDRRLFVGSGANAETITSLLTMADGVIVGTGIKADSCTQNAIDPAKARDFARAAGRR